MDSDSGSEGSDFTEQSGLNGLSPEEMEQMGYGDMGQPQTEEHLWMETLSESNKTIKFEGCDDAESSLILRRATINPECEDEERQVIQVISLDHNDKRVHGILCSLKLSGNCSVSLDGISCSPPTAFRLVKGKGPVTLIANLMKEDMGLLPDASDDESEEEESEEAKIEEIEDEKDLKRAAQEEAESSEEEAEKPQPKKQKVESPKKGKKNQSPAKQNGNAEPKTNGADKKKEAPKKEQKEKVERKKPENVAELIEQIKAHKGGRPKKQEKFKNWVRAIWKIDDAAMVDGAWKGLTA